MSVSQRRYMGRFDRALPVGPDSNQKPRWHTCRCVRSRPELGTYSGWRRCRGCGHIMGEWSTTQLPLAPPKYGPYHRRVA